MFIQTEATPNPATLKFLPGRIVMPEGTFDARSPETAAHSPSAHRLFRGAAPPSAWAQRLVEVPGVAGVFFGHDFVTVTKTDGEWQHLKPAILGAIMEHFMAGVPILVDQSGPAGDVEGEEFFEAADAET